MQRYHGFIFITKVDISVGFYTFKLDEEKGLPMAYFSRKMTPTHRRYPTAEQKMLAIVEVLKGYRNFLLGAVITIYTDHRNLPSRTSGNKRVFRWTQKIEEYGAKLWYVKFHSNLKADALSRLPHMEEDSGMEIMLNRVCSACALAYVCVSVFIHSRPQSSSPLRMTGRAVEELWEILEHSWLWLAVGRTMARRGVENEIAKYWLYAYADFPRALRFSTADKKTWALESRMERVV